MSVLKIFRLPETWISQLAKMAKETRRSEKFYVEAALRHYFEDYADAQIAKDRFNDLKFVIISNKDLRGRLGI